VVGILAVEVLDVQADAGVLSERLKPFAEESVSISPIFDA
jgi:hypothetical protein